MLENYKHPGPHPTDKHTFFTNGLQHHYLGAVREAFVCQHWLDEAQLQSTCFYFGPDPETSKVHQIDLTSVH